MPTDLLKPYQRRIERFLETVLPKRNPHYPSLAAAMQYSIYNGGKRLRPALVFMTANRLNTPLHIVDTAAAAVECVHCFSLVHDDLPAMDNSDFRRGQLSCHKVFGDDTAILAGDALLTLAFDVLSHDDINPLGHHKRMKMIKLLCQASGSEGMVAGQVMDIKNDSKHAYDLEKLKLLHQLKTGALIKNSVLLGALPKLSPQDENFKTLTHYGEEIGLLYQVCDDILDVVADEKLLGKKAGTDLALGKITYVDALGLDGAKAYAKQLCGNANELLETFNRPEQLIALTKLICDRALNYR